MPRNTQAPEATDDTSEVQRLRSENAELRAKLAAHGEAKPTPTEPSFGESEGDRLDRVQREAQKAVTE